MNIDIVVKENFEVTEDALEQMTRNVLQGDSYIDAIWRFYHRSIEDYQYDAIEKPLTEELEKRVAKAKAEGIYCLYEEQVDACNIFFEELKPIIQAETERGGKTPSEIFNHLYELFKTDELDAGMPITF